MTMTTSTTSGETLKVIDTDTHYSEPADLWVSRVPAKYRELVPHQVGSVEKGFAWLVNGDQVLSPRAGAGSVIRKDGSKVALWDWSIEGGMHVDEVHPASHNPAARVEFMDEVGVWAQIMYPNVAGFGGHKLMNLDPSLSGRIVSVYNDAMAEIQETSNGRLLPMALVPFWNIDMAVTEVARAASLGLKGIVMCSEPHAGGLPDLVDRHWDPLWELCTELQLPINLHVGASEFGMEAFMKGVWPSLDAERRHVVGCVQIEMHNGRILSNLLTSDLLVRFPETKWVSVESGIGWIPYVIERLEYQLRDTTPDGRGFDQPMPSELFRRQVYACFWFEDSGPSKLLEDIGFDNVLFETDFPHPTCLYPNAVEHAMKVLEPWGPEVQRKVMQDNAAQLYHIAL
jgi:predicted TIM-barrel fold metal-dependent hydrolase